MADSVAESEAAARAEYRKRIATLSLNQRELIGKAIIDGLINPDVLASSGGGGNYVQDGGGYTQSGGGNHWQGGSGNYTQNKTVESRDWAINPAELVNRLIDERLKVLELRLQNPTK